MATPLDDYLSALRFGGEQLGQAGASIAGQIKLQKAKDDAQRLRDVGAQLPDMIRSGQGLEVAGSLLDLAPDTANQLLKSATAGGKGSLSFEQLRAMAPGNVSDQQLEALATSGLDAPTQTKTALGLAGQAGAAEGRGLTRRGVQRLEKEYYNKPLEKFRTDFSKFEKEVADVDKAYVNVDKALKAKTLPADAVVFNFLARNVAGEKGPLSDTDREQFIARAFAGDVQKFENFMNGRSTSKLTAEQRKAFYDLVQSARGSYKNWKSETAANMLGNFALLPQLSEGGKPDKALEAKAKKYGIDLRFDKETGTVEAVRTKREKMKTDEGGNEADMAKMVQKIADPTMRQYALDELAKYKGQKVPDALMQKIKEVAGVK